MRVIWLRQWEQLDVQIRSNAHDRRELGPRIKEEMYYSLKVDQTQYLF